MRKECEHHHTPARDNQFRATARYYVDSCPYCEINRLTAQLAEANKQKADWHNMYQETYDQLIVWIPVTERMPEPNVPVIALVNPNDWGKTFCIRAQYAPAKTLELDFDAEGGEYDEETDKYYCEEGWYETNEFEDVHWNVHGTITHWQPLPEIPEELKVKA